MHKLCSQSVFPFALQTADLGFLFFVCFVVVGGTRFAIKVKPL